MKPMKKIIMVVVIVFILPLFVTCNLGYVPFSITYPYGVDWLIWIVGVHPATYNFNLYIPDDYSSTTDDYPILVSLHGGGTGFSRPGPHPLNELGGGPLIQLFDSGSVFHPERRGDVHPAVRRSFVVFPEEQEHNWNNLNGGNGYWNAPALNLILEYLISEYRIDTTRIYITGGSYGGWGTWYITKNETPELRPAAIIPLCGAWDEIGEGGMSTLGNFSDLPIWQFQSLDDGVVTYPHAIATLQAVIPAHPVLMAGYPSSPSGDYTIGYDEATGLGPWNPGVVSPTGRVAFTMFRAAGHGGTGDLANVNPAVWDWLFAQSR